MRIRMREKEQNSFGEERADRGNEGQRDMMPDVADGTSLF
jgi:hypothetical protein